MSQNQKLISNKRTFKYNKKLTLSQDEILELAVKAVVNPTYGWITTALIVYGCRPVECLSLIPQSDGAASVVNFNKNSTRNIRRKLLASPIDFVEKLNIYDQVSRPLYYGDLKDYDFDELNKFMFHWNSWFKDLKCNLDLKDIRDYWAERILDDGISIKLAAKYMGITHAEFLDLYINTEN